MNSDAHDPIDDLGELLARVEQSIKQNKPISISRKSSTMGFGVSTNLSIRIGLLESLTHDSGSHVEPLIDVIDDCKSIKVIAQIPGIDRNDIDTSVHDGYIDVMIKKNTKTIHKNIPCNITPNQVLVKSFSYNNSVLEIIFDRVIQ